jgi:hypothetical protein
MSANKKSSKLKKFLIDIVELFDREIVFDKQDNIYVNDLDNMYPNRMEILERNSKTAISCSRKLGQYVVGKGFQNPDKNLKSRSGLIIDLNEALSRVVESVRTHRGAFIHINYDAEGNPNYFDVLDYKKCRISKTDHFGYSGLIIYKDWSKKSSMFDLTKEKDIQWFYPYNPKNLTAQRVNDVKVLKMKNPTLEDSVRVFRGQVLFFTLDKTQIYPYSWLSGQAIYDADSEFRLSLYRNNSIRKGFQDKTMFLLNGFDNDTKKDFDKTSKEWLGAENYGSVFTFSTPEFVEDPAKLIVPIQLKSSYDSKKFEFDERAFEDSISKCYLDIPKVLINDREGGVFGSSGNAILEAQKLYSNATAFLRKQIEDLFYDLFKIEGNEILPLVSDKNLDSSDQIRLKSQAELKGSVGGVTALLGVVKAVNAGEITKESALEIIKEIYGITEELANKMLTLKIENNG